MTHARIISGPSKSKLRIAFLVGPNFYSPNRCRSVSFTIEDPSCPRGLRQIEIFINRLSRKDGSDESWCFEGYCKTSAGQLKTPSTKVRGLFRTSDRKGWVDIDVLVQRNTSKTIIGNGLGLYVKIDDCIVKR